MKTLLAFFTSLLSLGAFAQPYTISVGSAANDNTGDTIRSALIKVNSNTVYFAAQAAATNRVAVNSGVANNLTISGASVSTVTNSDLTASRVMVLDSAKRQTNSTVTATELAHLSGVTANVQTNIDGRISTLNGNATNLTAVGLVHSNYSDQKLVELVDGEKYHLTSVTRDSNDVATNAVVRWPDGTFGVFTATAVNSTFQAVDAYTITYTNLGKTITQPLVTRNTSGAVTAAPALTVSP